MNTITIAKVTPMDNERLIVTGTVDGVGVSAEGVTGRVKNAKSEAHKNRYLEELLLAAAPLKEGDAAVKGRFFKNVWIWVLVNWKTVALAVLIEELLRHIKY